jgi:hypothetical protein
MNAETTNGLIDMALERVALLLEWAIRDGETIRAAKLRTAHDLIASTLKT